MELRYVTGILRVLRGKALDFLPQFTKMGDTAKHIPWGGIMPKPVDVTPLVWTTPQFCKALELPRSTLAYYEATGLIRPLRRGRAGRPGPETGHSLWGPREVRRLALIKRLKRMRVSLQGVRKVLAFAERQNYDVERVTFRVRWASGGVIKDVVIVDPNAAISTLSRPGQMEFDDLTLRSVPVRDVVRKAEKRALAVAAAA